VKNACKHDAEAESTTFCPEFGCLWPAPRRLECSTTMNDRRLHRWVVVGGNIAPTCIAHHPGARMSVMNEPTTTELPSATWPVCDDEQIEAAQRVLRSGRLNYWTGDEGRQFEREFSQYIGVEHAVAVSSGTAALELAMAALNIGPGDEVIVPCRTFFATASCVVRCGATPIFADVDRDSQNITADTIRPRLTKRTKAVIVVHLAGWPCDMDAIVDLAAGRGLAVVEDCAQAHGARYKGRPVGSMGHVGAFSFCHDKIMTTAGEGGMVVTNNPELWKRAWSLKDHGKNFSAAYPSPSASASQAPSGSFRWLHDEIGANWRMTEVQAAIGRVALRKLDAHVAARRRNAALLQQRFQLLPLLRTTPPPQDVVHSYYKYYTFVRPEKLAENWTRDRILKEINQAGISCQTGSCPEIYLEKAFPLPMRPPERLPVARELGETSLMFQVHPTLTPDHMNRIADVVAAVVTQADMPR
jgi:dTDP-4-amino-4,6-dideoxygalactose transaminase